MLSFLVIGLIQGAVYALVALGIVLVYRGARVFNFAQGEYGTVAAFVAWILIAKAQLPYGVGIIGALAAALLMGLVMERLIVRPMFASPRVILLVATVGVAFLAIALEQIIGQAQGRILPPAISGDGVRIFDVQVSAQHLFIVFVLGAVAATLAWFFSRTNTGLAVLAMAQEPMATRIVGIRIKRMSQVVWGLAALLGGVAGVLQAPLFPFFPGEMTSIALLPAFTGAVLGGITSLWGALAGGLLVGAIQGLAQFFIGERIPGGANLVLFAVLLVVLLVRPGGLWGRAPSGAEGVEHVSASRKMRFRLPPLDARAKVARYATLAAVLLAVVLVPLALPAFRADQIAFAATFAIVGLSINMIMGYTGQISLGHQAFVGIGAFASANFVSQLGASFWVALPVAAATGALAAGALGLVALRLRGLHLALITLAYGSVAEQSIFAIRELTGGGAGAEAPRPAGFLSDETYLGVSGDHTFMYLAFAVLAVVLFVDWRFIRSKAGRAVLAIRQNEMVAASYGVDVTRFKVFAFVLSGVFAGIAGALLAHRRGVVVSNDFEFNIALTFVLMTVVGGLGSRTGVIIGSLFFALFPLVFSTLTVYIPAVGAALLLYTLVRHPGGVGEQLDPIVRWFKGEVPGRLAAASVVGVFALLSMLAVLLSALAAREWRVIVPLLVAVFFWSWLRKRLKEPVQRRAAEVGAAAWVAGAVVASFAVSDFRVLAFAVPVPLLMRLANRIAAPAMQPAGPAVPDAEAPSDADAPVDAPRAGVR